MVQERLGKHTFAVTKLQDHLGVSLPLAGPPVLAEPDRVASGAQHEGRKAKGARRPNAAQPERLRSGARVG